MVSSNKIQNALLVMIIPSLFYSSLMFWSPGMFWVLPFRGKKKKIHECEFMEWQSGWMNHQSWKLLMPEKRPLKAMALFKPLRLVNNSNEIPIFSHCLHHYYTITFRYEYRTSLIIFRESLRFLLTTDTINYPENLSNQETI